LVRLADRKLSLCSAGMLLATLRVPVTETEGFFNLLLAVILSAHALGSDEFASLYPQLLLAATASSSSDRRRAQYQVCVWIVLFLHVRDAPPDQLACPGAGSNRACMPVAAVAS
jgi:hypothetical protein